MPPHRVRILLVDDHTILRVGIRRVLEEHCDFEVVGEAADGYQALDAARATRPDVVLMDVSMPRMGGIEATRRLLDEQPHVRIIGLSMHDAVEVMTAMQQAGAAAYLTKGCEPDTLCDAIRKLAPPAAT